MNTTSTRIARLTAASALVLGLGLGTLGAGTAFAENPARWSWSAPNSVTFAVDDGAGTDALIFSGDAALEWWTSPGAKTPIGHRIATSATKDALAVGPVAIGSAPGRSEHEGTNGPR